MNTQDAIILARKHAGNNAHGQGTSARLCLADAVALHAAGDLTAAKKRAVDSLKFSVGVCHTDYARAAK